MEEVLETPARIAAKSGPQVVVVLDEFQQILQYGNDHVERKLRSVILRTDAGTSVLHAARLKSASNAQRAVHALLAKDVIDRDNGSFLITDRFLRLWIQSVQSA